MVEDPITRRLLLASIPLVASGATLQTAFIAVVGWPFNGRLLAYSSATLLLAAGLSFLLLRSACRRALRTSSDPKQRREVARSARSFAIVCCGLGALAHMFALVSQQMIRMMPNLLEALTAGQLIKFVLPMLLQFGIVLIPLAYLTVGYARRLKAACQSAIEADSEGPAEPDKAPPPAAAEKPSPH